MNARSAVVLGASRGIGHACALALARAGWRVVAAARAAASCAPLVEMIRAEGGAAEAAACDVTDYAAVAELAERVGPAGAVFHNAGKIFAAGPLATVDPAAWRDGFALNLAGPLHAIRAFAPGMAAAGGGAMVINAARSGLHGNAAIGLYSASKAAAIMLTQVAAREFGPAGVRINAIAPGYIGSEAWMAMLGGQVDALSQNVALRRIGTPAEVGELVAWLLSDASGYLTGTVIPIDGGM